MPIEKQPKRWSVPLFLAVISGLLACCLLLQPWQQTFRGKTLGGWIDKFDYDRNFVDRDGRRLPAYAEDLAAIKTFGSNAVPVLLGMLQARDNFLRFRIQAWARRFYPFVRVSNRPLVHFFQTAAAKRNLAFEVLSELGESAAEALPVYRSILEGPNSDLKLDVITLVGGLGTNASGAYPEIMACLKMGGSRFQLNALSAIGRLGVVTPELTETLLRLRFDPDEQIRRNAHYSIQNLGLSSFLNTTNGIQASTLSIMKNNSESMPSGAANLPDPLPHSSTIKSFRSLDRSRMSGE